MSLVPDTGTHEDAVSLDDDVRPPDVCLRGTNDGGTHSQEADEAVLDADPGDPFDDHDHEALLAFIDTLDLAEDAA